MMRIRKILRVVFSILFILCLFNFRAYFRFQNERMQEKVIQQEKVIVKEIEIDNNEEFEKSNEEDQAIEVPIKKPKLIILLSSLGRSGSSFVGDLLASKENSVFFYEPDHKTEHQICSKVSECMVSYIKDVLTCNYANDFESWLRRRNFIYHYHPNMAECRGNTKCKWTIDMRTLCRNADYRIAKVIRVRLGFLETLITDKTVDAKIVYLVRDPRGAAQSIKKMHWNDSPYRVCSHVHFDFSAYQYLSKKYPGRLYKVQYELMSLEPERIAREMFEFAYGDKELPEKTLEWVKDHTQTAQHGSMSTKRDSKNHYQEWRWTITEEMLLSIEAQLFCKMAFKQLGYNKFNTTANCRNKDIPMIIHKPEVY